MMRMILLGDSQNPNFFLWLPFVFVLEVIFQKDAATPNNPDTLFFFLFCQENRCHFRQDQVMILKGQIRCHSVFNFILCLLPTSPIHSLFGHLHPQEVFPLIQALIQAKHLPRLASPPHG